MHTFFLLYLYKLQYLKKKYQSIKKITDEKEEWKGKNICNEMKRYNIDNK